MDGVSLSWANAPAVAATTGMRAANARVIHLVFSIRTLLGAGPRPCGPIGEILGRADRRGQCSGPDPRLRVRPPPREFNSPSVRGGRRQLVVSVGGLGPLLRG